MDLLDDDPQLREALHAAVSGGPEAPSLDRLLLEAHRARRGQSVRRTAGGLAVAAALGAVAFTGAQLLQAPATGGDDRTGIAADPDKGEEQKPTDLWVHVTATGKLVASPGTEILRTVEDPLDRRPGGRSWGVVVQRGDNELWGLVDWSEAGTLSSVEPAELRYAAFDDWLDYEVAASTGTVEPFPVYFDQDGVLQPTGSTRLVRQTEDVDLGQDPSADVLTAAAEITIGGEREFLFAKHAVGRRPVYLVVPDSFAPDSFTELVERSAAIYADVTR